MEETEVIRLARMWRLSIWTYQASANNLNPEVRWLARTKIEQEIRRRESLFWQALADYDDEIGYDGPCGGLLEIKDPGLE